MILLATFCVFLASLAAVFATVAVREHLTHQTIALRLARPSLHTPVITSAQRDARRSSIPWLDRVLGVGPCSGSASTCSCSIPVSPCVQVPSCS
jgi:hypothetical protein